MTTARRSSLLQNTSMFGLILAAAIAVGGCAAQPPTERAGGPDAIARPATTPAVVADAAPVLRPITYERKFTLRVNDVMQVSIAVDGSYKVVRKGGGGPSSSKSGRLTADQRHKLAAAFAGWDKLNDDYPDPGGADEVYRVTIDYGGKTVTASDAALRLPQTFRDAYRQLRELVSEAGMV